MAPTRLRRIVLVMGAALALLWCTTLGLGCALAVPRWQGPTTTHFDGDRFFTPDTDRTNRPGFSEMMKWLGNRQHTPWPPFHEEPPGPPPPREVGPGAMRVTFINHATTLIQLDGVNVLTDPMYSERCSPFDFVGPRRVRPPGIRFTDLPPIHAAVISHNHYDHLDVPTLKRLADTWPGVVFFVGLGNKAFLQKRGLSNVVELDWWDARQLKGITIRSVPNQHFSNRSFTDSDGALWTAWSLEGSAGKAYFGGDTGYGPHFKAAAERLGPFRLAVLPVGAYRPEWFMGPIHQSPAQAVDAALDLRATLAVPMHYGTFDLADDGETEAPEKLKEALASKPAPFAILDFGEGRDVPQEATP